MCKSSSSCSEMIPGTDAMALHCTVRGFWTKRSINRQKGQPHTMGILQWHWVSAEASMSTLLLVASPCYQCSWHGWKKGGTGQQLFGAINIFHKLEQPKGDQPAFNSSKIRRMQMVNIMSLSNTISCTTDPSYLPVLCAVCLGSP